MLCRDADRRSADSLVTVGAAQSNHARVGWETHLALGGTAEVKPEGNQLLSTLFGATIHHAGTDSWPELELAMNEPVTYWTETGRHPNVIPIGGSTPVGALGFVLGWADILSQLDERSRKPAAVVVASSTGGTHAGILAGRELSVARRFWQSMSPSPTTTSEPQPLITPMKCSNRQAVTPTIFSYEPELE